MRLRLLTNSFGCHGEKGSTFLLAWATHHTVTVNRETATAVGQVAATGAVALPAPRFDPRNLGWVVAAFLGGILIGMIVLLAYAWVKVG